MSFLSIENQNLLNITDSDEEDDNILVEDDKTIIQRKVRIKSRPANKRRRYQLPNRACRLTRLTLYSVFSVIVIFCMLYMQIYTNVPSRQFALPDWGYNTSRNICDYVLPDIQTTLLEPRHVCEDKTFVLIVVCSSLTNFAARQTIRETWGNSSEFNYDKFYQLHSHLSGQYLNPLTSRINYYRPFLKISTKNVTTAIMSTLTRVVFLIGRSKYERFLGNETLSRIHNEHELYDDIVQENFIDTYNNLTLKSIFALKWVTNRCLHKTAFVMKCDDDTFVNIPNLIHFLLGGTVPLYNDTFEFYDTHTYQTLVQSNRMNKTNNYLVGHLFCKSRPVANVSSKWYMPRYMFADDKYPQYLSGSGYLMTMDVISRLYNAALNTSLVYLEDVYLTGVCAEKANIERRHHPLFGYTRSKELCSFKGMITQHELKDDSMSEAYSFVANFSNRCAPPAKYFKRIRLRKSGKCL